MSDERVIAEARHGDVPYRVRTPGGMEKKSWEDDHGTVHWFPVSDWRLWLVGELLADAVRRVREDYGFNERRVDKLADRVAALEAMGKAADAIYGGIPGRVAALEAKDSDLPRAYTSGDSDVVSSATWRYIQRHVAREIVERLRADAQFDRFYAPEEAAALWIEREYGKEGDRWDS